MKTFYKDHNEQYAVKFEQSCFESEEEALSYARAYAYAFLKAENKKFNDRINELETK